LGITLHGRKELLAYRIFYRGEFSFPPSSVTCASLSISTWPSRNTRRKSLPISVPPTPSKASTTALETIQRNAGGLFHTEREATVKIYILVDRLQRSTWLQPSGRLAIHLAEWFRYFQNQYQPELASTNVTQHL